MAKFITFNGVTLIHPGGLTKVDATGMAQVGFGISGVVGVIGEADYGEPYDVETAAGTDGCCPQSLCLYRPRFYGGDLQVWTPGRRSRLPI